MALTLKTEPANYMPGYNPIEYSFTSTNTTNANFKYTFKLYIEGSLVDTWRVAPHANNKEGRIDVSRAIARHIKEAQAQYESTSMFSIAQTQPIVKYRVDAIEYYGTTPTEVEETNVTGNDRYAWSASFEHHDWYNQINETSPFNTWLMNTTNGTSARFLTNYRSTNYVSINDYGWLTLLTSAPADVNYAQIISYDSSGSIIKTCQVNSVLSGSTTNLRMQTVMSAPATLNAYSGSFASGSAPIIPSNTAYYTIQIFESAIQPMSEVYRFDIKEPCKFEQYRIHFLNELGGIDAFNFQKRNQLSSTTTRKSYKRSKDFFNGSGNIVYNHEDNGTQDYYVKNRDKVKLRTDWLTEGEIDWLKELINSPLCFLEFTDLQGNQNFKPIRVVSNNWVDKDIEIDKLFKLEIDIEFSHENFRQRR
jgi:hypothetical protein